MKKIYMLIIVFATLQTLAQTKTPLYKHSTSIKSYIEKVVRDYYDHFNNIIGDKLNETQSTVEYQSKVVPEGATASTILQIKGLNNVYSWQAVMLKTDDYSKAIEKYQQIYIQLNGTKILMQDNKTWKFQGTYDEPDDKRAFASSMLEPDTDDKVIKRLKVEVALNYNMPDWTVMVFVYEKESDEDIRPTETPGE
jgi:hypothetical protein